jgi:hypothetical protein
MSIRDDIIDAYVSMLTDITVANGYSLTVKTVEVASRGWDEMKTRPDLRPWMGVVPHEEVFTEFPSYVDSELPIDIEVYQTASARTAAAVQQANSDVVADIRKALYEDPQLGVNGVVRARLVRASSSTAHPQAAQEGVASVLVSTTVLFEELLGA